MLVNALPSTTVRSHTLSCVYNPSLVVVVGPATRYMREAAFRAGAKGDAVGWTRTIAALRVNRVAIRRPKKVTEPRSLLALVRCVQQHCSDSSVIHGPIAIVVFIKRHLSRPYSNFCSTPPVNGYGSAKVPVTNVRRAEGLRPNVSPMQDQKIVLVLDDNAFSRHAIHSTLATEYRVMLVETPEEAIRICKWVTPDLLIADSCLKAPISGIETVRRVHALKPEVPTLLVSATPREYWLDSDVEYCEALATTAHFPSTSEAFYGSNSSGQRCRPDERTCGLWMSHS